MKRCTDCGIEKHESEFHVDRSKKDGRQYRCKLCKAELNREYRQVIFLVRNKKMETSTLPKANRKRGSQPVAIGAGSAKRLLEYLDEKDLTHLLPPVRPKIKSKHLNPLLLAPKYRKAFTQERSRYSDLY